MFNDFIVRKLHQTQEKLLVQLQVNSFLISELHKLQEDLEIMTMTTEKKINVFDDNKINKFINNDDIMFQGADNVVKNSVEYKIGNMMIESTKSWKNLFTLAPKLYIEYSQSNTIDFELDLSMYIDEKKGEKVKEQLSYRLGKTFIEDMNSSSKLRLPYHLYKEVMSFKKKRQ